MKKREMTLKEFCMRYPFKEMVLKEDGDGVLVETEVWSRSLIHQSFNDNAMISFNEYTIAEEEAKLDDIIRKKKTDNIFELYDVMIDGKKCYGKDNCISQLTKKEFVELVNSVKSFRDGVIVM